MGYTSSEFLESVKRGVTMPSQQNRFTDTDLLAFADEETQEAILPELLQIRQDFLVKRGADIEVVANQPNYKIPYRAVGRKLFDLKLATPDGTIIRSLPFISTSEKTSFLMAGYADPMGFTIEGENIVLLPTPKTSGIHVLQNWYELAPSLLILEENAGAVTGIDTITGEVTIATEVAAFTSGSIMDIIDGKTGNSVITEDIACTNVATNVLTFDPTELPSELKEGDYIAFSNQTPVVQLPNELTQVLVQAVICRCLESQGDLEALDRAVSRLAKRMDAAMKLLTPRVEKILPVVIRRNGLLSQRPFTARYRSSI